MIIVQLTGQYHLISMVVSINFLSILAAAVVSMVIGFLWYGPIFGKQWTSMMGTTPEKMQAAKDGMAKNYGLMFLGSLAMAYVLYHSLVFGNSYLQEQGAISGLMVGFFNWFGFVAPVTLGSVLWEGRPWKLWLLNNGYYLVTLMAMGVVMAMWM